MTKKIKLTEKDGEILEVIKHPHNDIFKTPKKALEMIVFSNGDSTKYATWSNVPCFLTEALENKDVMLHRENILLEDNNALLTFLIKCCNYLIRKVGSLLHPNQRLFCTVERSLFYDYWVKRKMLQAQRKYPEADVLFTFDFSHVIPSAQNQKSVLFCDWTIEYAITTFQKRKPIFWERVCINREKKVMQQADAIITIFPNSHKEIAKEYPGKSFYLGNLINSKAVNVSNLENLHFISDRVLFIGREKYKSGAQSLIKAIRLYKKQTGIQLYLDIVGMDQNILNETDEFITYHGYLDKSEEKQNQLYYDLIANAKCICNTTENWASASSIIEAMYWKCPVIVNPSTEIYETFGSEIKFGFYCKTNEPKDVYACICKIMALSQKEYYQYARMSAEAVQDFTYDAYVERMLKEILLCDANAVKNNAKNDAD